MPPSFIGAHELLLLMLRHFVNVYSLQHTLETIDSIIITWWFTLEGAIILLNVKIREFHVSDARILTLSTHGTYRRKYILVMGGVLNRIEQRSR